MICFVVKKMWGDGSDDETGTFCPGLLSLVSKCAHQMDIMGLDGMGIRWWEPHIDWGADEAEMATNAHRGMRG